MNTLTCIIVDDEPLAVRLLESYVERTAQLRLIGSFTDSVEALAAIRQQLPALVFLDIQMPDVDGMELARLLPAGTRVVFTTAFKEYAFESYEVSAVDFLLKPIRYSRFLTAVEKVSASAPSNNSSSLPGEVGRGASRSSIFIRVDGELRQVSFDEIVYVGGMKDYVMFYVDGERRPLITHMTMKAVEDALPADRFMRINRSYIVALSRIRSIDRNNCVYIGNEIIHVTEQYREAFERYCSGNC